MIAEIVLLIIAVCLLLYFIDKKDNLPPGPWSIPFIGNLPLTNKDQCLAMQKKYGNMFMMRVGVYRFLYILDYKLSKEAYFKMEFNSRPSFSLLQFFKVEKQQDRASGIIFSNGNVWHNNRRFLLRHLRDLGMGKSRMEGVIMREVENLVEDFKLLIDKPAILPMSLNIAILNVIWQLVSGHRYEFTEKKVEDFMTNMDNARRFILKSAISDVYPIIRYILPESVINYLTSRSKFHNAMAGFTNIVQPVIDEHLAKLDPNNPIDLMDDYLIEMQEKKAEEYSHFSLNDLTRITLDLFIAGNDTTANMTRWVLQYMAKYPSIQKKVQEEIDSVVERDTFPGLEHKDKLTYVDATINEVQRHCSMVAFGLMHSTNSDVVLEGYNIPKDTVVFSVAALIHRDPTYFKNPDDFDPSRFLDANGKFISTCDGFQAFGLGKRQCIGEQFARMELYLIVSALLQTFTFSSPAGNEINLLPSDIPTVHFPNREQKFLIKLRK